MIYFFFSDDFFGLLLFYDKHAHLWLHLSSSVSQSTLFKILKGSGHGHRGHHGHQSHQGHQGHSGHPGHRSHQYPQTARP